MSSERRPPLARALLARMRSSSAKARSSSSLGVNGMTWIRRGWNALPAISVLSRRTVTALRACSSRFAPRLNRRLSTISSRAVNDSVCPLCGVADRNSRCSHRAARSRVARVRWLSTAYPLAADRARAGRRDMVRLVDDEHVEREPARAVGPADVAEHVAQQPLRSQRWAATPC